MSNNDRLYKKILFITPYPPRKNGIGIEKRAWQHFEALSAMGEVDLLITYRGNTLQERSTQDHEWKSRSNGYFAAKVTGISPTGPLGRIFNAIAAYSSLTYRLGKVDIEHLANVFGRPDYDAVFCFRIRSKVLWDQLQSHLQICTHRLIVDFDDIESKAAKRALYYASATIGRQMSFWESLHIRRLDRLEKQILRCTDDVIVCSEEDMQDLQSDALIKAHIHKVPNIIDISDITRAPDNSPLTILFVGTMNFPPNADGAKFLVQQVLPLLRRYIISPFQILIVGYSPTADVLALNDIPEITVTGGVDNIAEFYACADVAIAPIRFGGGTRIKILEAMAYGVPVVSTPLGAEGIEALDHIHILLATGAEDFAKAIARILSESALHKTLQANARQLVKSTYSLNVAKSTIAGILTTA